MSHKRVLLVFGACIAMTAVLVGVVFLNSGQASGRTVYTQLKVLTEVLSLVTEHYVEDVEPEELVNGAIKGLLDELDPHSNYLDPDRFKRLQERNKGSYFGIGVSFEIVNGDLTVISPIEGGPSERLGIRPGDIIAQINGNSAKGITQEEVFEKLRGPRGTMVTVSIKRPGEEELIDVDIVRDQIPIYSVPYSFMVEPGVGYIRMIRFSGTTSDELEESLRELEALGMEKLILDLRGNSGGYLNEAIEVADKFLGGGKKIVYTLGRIADSNEEYYSSGRGRHTHYPLIVMINHASASASEIVSGAVQDWDRGLVVGRTSFGKGLVQRQYQLHNGGALLLTVARYHTPSGRLIQRDYSDKDKYVTETVEDIERIAETDSTGEAMPLYQTAGGRTVRGGGGITPDVNLTQRWRWSELQRSIDRAYFDFANKYIGETGYEAPPFEEFLERFKVTDDVLSGFEDYLDDKEIEYSPDSLAAEIDQVRAGIKREMARNLWGENERYQILIKEDPQVAAALELFPQAELMARNEPTGDWQSRN